MVRVLNDGVQALKHSRLRHLKRARDADALLDIHADLLLRHPAVDVLQDFKRRLRVAACGCVVQDRRDCHLAVRAALKFCQFGQWVKLAELAVLGREQARRQGERVALQTFTRGVIDRVKTRLGRGEFARFVGYGMPAHSCFLK